MVYRILGQLATLEIAEMCVPSGADCGSLFLDLRFRELVRTLLADHPVHLDAASLAYFVDSFSQMDKLTYRGEVDDGACNSVVFQPLPIIIFLVDSMFHFTCFNVDDPDDPQVGLFNGELSLPGILLRREVFEPVVNQVMHLSSTPCARKPSTCTVICLNLAVAQVLELIEEQMKKVSQRIDALLLVGGFSGSEYLFKSVEVSEIIRSTMRVYGGTF